MSAGRAAPLSDALHDVPGFGQVTACVRVARFRTFLARRTSRLAASGPTQVATAHRPSLRLPRGPRGSVVPPGAHARHRAAAPCTQSTAEEVPPPRPRAARARPLRDHRQTPVRERPTAGGGVVGCPPPTAPPPSVAPFEPESNSVVTTVSWFERPSVSGSVPPGRPGSCERHALSHRAIVFRDVGSGQRAYALSAAVGRRLPARGPWAELFGSHSGEARPPCAFHATFEPERVSLSVG